MEWIDYIFGGNQSGYVYVALSKKDAFKQFFFKFPEEKDKLRQLAGNKKKGDIYFCPALFSQPSGKSRDVSGSWVTWVDLDHQQQLPANVPAAGLTIGSGSPGRTHKYWRSPVFLTGPELVERNFYLTTALRADPSGIDPCQLLRVPGTLNHKHTPAKPVEIKFFEPTEVDIPTLPRNNTVAVEYSLLPLEEVLVSRQLPKVAKELYIRGTKDRSSGLMRLAFELSEHGFEPDQVYTLLYTADERWGKFAERDDKELRLSEIVTRSRVAADFSMPTDDVSTTRRLISWKKIGTTQHSINWLYEGLLREKGLAAFVGLPGAGKSQLAIQLTACSALELPFLDQPFQGPSQKILYSSVEMDDMELNYVLDKMSGVLTEDQLDILDSRVDFLPLGYSLPLDTLEVQAEYEEMLEEGIYTGLVIDSLSASVSESLKDETQVRRVLDWVDRTRQKYGIWILLVSHVRKPPASTKQYAITASDIYGAQLVSQRANSAVALTQLPDHSLEYRFVKGRQKDLSDSLQIKRSQHLWFTVQKQSSTGKSSAEPKQQLYKPGPDVIFDID